jgi:hypothetical protein
MTRESELNSFVGFLEKKFKDYTIPGTKISVDTNICPLPLPSVNPARAENNKKM